MIRMLTEACRICDADVPYSHTVHLLLHTKSDAGVVDYYICQSCYETKLKPLLTADP